jgi:hypothetical protein
MDDTGHPKKKELRREERDQKQPRRRYLGPV